MHYNIVVVNIKIVIAHNSSLHARNNHPTGVFVMTPPPTKVELLSEAVVHSSVCLMPLAENGVF